MHYKQALERCVFLYTSGSHQYGTNRPDSDVDKRGVFIAPLEEAYDIFKTSYVGGGTTIYQTLSAAIDAIANGDPKEGIRLQNMPYWFLFFRLL